MEIDHEFVVGRFNIVNLIILSKVIFKQKAIPSKIMMIFLFFRKRKTHHKIYMTQYSQNNLEKSKIGGLTLSDFKFTIKNTVMRTEI